MGIQEMHDLTPHHHPEPQHTPSLSDLAHPLPTPSTTQALGLPPAIRALGDATLEKQLWCLGQDIRRPEGNLMMEYGFERNRPGTNVMGSSAYSLNDGTTQVVVWGWGIAIAEAGKGALWIRRNNFDPQWSPIEEIPSTVFRPEDLPRSMVPSTPEEEGHALHLFQTLCSTLAKYETWIDLNQQSSYRADILARHPSRRQEDTTETHDMAGQWLTLSEMIDTFQ